MVYNAVCKKAGKESEKLSVQLFGSGRNTKLLSIDLGLELHAWYAHPLKVSLITEKS